MPFVFKYAYKAFGDEISKSSRFYDSFVELCLIDGVENPLFDYVECSSKTKRSSLSDIDDFKKQDHVMLLLNGTLNYHEDIQGLLSGIYRCCRRDWRVVLLCYNSYFKWFYSLASFLGLRKGVRPKNFLTDKIVDHFCRLGNFEIVKVRPRVHCPFYWGGVGPLLNKVLSLIPLVKKLSLGSLFFLRPIVPEKTCPSLSIIIPVRNEAGNLQTILDEFEGLEDVQKEFIFVEGHSTDETWKVVGDLQKQDRPRSAVKAYRQSGEGKYNAVQLGFARAAYDLLVIVDGDKTMPPKEVVKFYRAYCDGKGDFINGSRLIYSMETKAMQFLNLMCNILFAKGLALLLEMPITDSLCGTKLMSRKNAMKLLAWKKNVKELDPFGDFELLFFASRLHLGLVDIPIKYRRRYYGVTQIRRFYHGFQLVRVIFRFLRHL